MDDHSHKKIHELDSKAILASLSRADTTSSTPVPRTPQEGPYRLSQTKPSDTRSAERPPRGLLLAFEGLDRSGKSTQCALLCERLRERGETIEHVRFPNRTTPIGLMINSYLTGESVVEDHVVHLLFSANRWEVAPRIRELLEQGMTVVVDRYYYSGCVYSAAKGLENLSLEWARQPDVGLPRPDLCVFLDVSPDVAARRAGFGGEVYEKAEMQRKVREGFEALMKHGDEADDVVVVNADRGVEEVERTVGMWVERVRERVKRGGMGVGSVRAW